MRLVHLLELRFALVAAYVATGSRSNKLMAGGREPSPRPRAGWRYGRVDGESSARWPTPARRRPGHWDAVAWLARHRAASVTSLVEVARE